MQVPVKYSLSQNYPNPFNPISKIRFSIPVYSHVLIKVYDVLGSEVSTIVNEERPPGIYEADFSATRLASGIYYYKITTSGGYSETKKMVLLN